MTTPVRILSAAFVAVLIAAAGPAPAAHSAATSAPPAGATPPAEASAAAAPRLTRVQKIEELVGYLGYKSDAQHIDVAIPYLAADVAATDPAWNHTHPRWSAVSALIRRNLHADAQEALVDPEAAVARSAQQALMDGVVGEDLDAALAFFRSTTGRHFLELQDALIDLGIEVGLEQDTQAARPSVENFDARRRVLEMWLPIVFMRAMYGPNFADRAIDSAYQKYSRLRGAQLDALAERFAADLPQFEQFTRSASFHRIMDAQKEAGRQTPAPNLATFFATEAKRHASEWHAAYQGT